MSNVIPYPLKRNRFETPFISQVPDSTNVLRLDLKLSGELARRIHADSLRFGKRPEAFVIDGLHALMGIGGDAA